MRELIFYKTTSGKCPVQEFLDKLSSKQARKAAWVLSLIEELETVPGQYFKKLVNTEDLWEVRVRTGSNNFRFLSFFDGPYLVVLAHAFQKKTQKIPWQALRVAEERKSDYLKRRKRK